jgi:hypothetical protein
MPTDDTGIEAFAVKDCALIALATGRRAHNLRELRDHLRDVDAGSVYHHFWGSRLRPQFDDPEYNNDFAAWARHGLHDWVLAERLAVVDPTEVDGVEGLRQELLELIEQRLDEHTYIPWARRDQQFDFLTSQLVVFDTGRRVTAPKELATTVPAMSVGSVFYHFIEGRTRNPGRVDDFCAWLAARGDRHAGLQRLLSEVDPFFSTLVELRAELTTILQGYFAEAAA